MSIHPQTWVKVNAPVDAKIAELVRTLNHVEGLETLQSCQGETGGHHGYIYFSLGKWQNLCRFVFDDVAPRLNPYLGEDVKLEVIAAERPIAKMSFSAEAIARVTSALKEMINS